MPTVKAYAATAAGQPLSPFAYEAGPLGPENVEIRVESCGICHSDLSMINNDWGLSAYPFVPGHEAVGMVESVGERVTTVKPGDLVGVGWYSASCMKCPQCMRGDHNLCGQVESTMIGRHGGYASHVRAHWSWAIPVPAGVEAKSAGPLFCGGITVFNPILACNVKPTERVGVVGIGGLGHMALRFLRAWGCEVYAFSSNPAKAKEVMALGAHHVVNSRSAEEIKALAGKLDFILVTVNVSLDWDAYTMALSPRGRLHVVGVVPEPIPVVAFNLIQYQKSVSGSPLGSPATVATMLEFCARHGIAPQIEEFPMAKVNDALEHLHAGKARYRIVLTN